MKKFLAFLLAALLLCLPAAAFAQVSPTLEELTADFGYSVQVIKYALVTKEKGLYDYIPANSAQAANGVDVYWAVRLEVRQPSQAVRDHAVVQIQTTALGNVPTSVTIPVGDLETGAYYYSYTGQEPAASGRMASMPIPGWVPGIFPLPRCCPAAAWIRKPSRSPPRSLWRSPCRMLSRSAPMTLPSPMAPTEWPSGSSPSGKPPSPTWWPVCSCWIARIWSPASSPPAPTMPTPSRRLTPRPLPLPPAQENPCWPGWAAADAARPAGFHCQRNYVHER